MRAKNHKHLIQLQTRTGISVLRREMQIQHVSGFPCCISSVRSTSVILQLFDPLRFSTSCFGFANVRKKTKQETVASDARGDRAIPLTEDLSPRKPSLRKRLCVLRGAWPSAHCASHVFCLAFRISQRQNKTGFQSINLVDFEFRGMLFIPFNTAILLKNLT